MFFRGLDEFDFVEELELAISEFLEAFFVDEILLFEGFEHLGLSGVEHCSRKERVFGCFSKE
jgi:hypothetical protein